MLFRGHGVEKSVAKAKEMWQNAAEAGVESSKEALHAMENYSLKVETVSQTSELRHPLREALFTEHQSLQAL